MTRSWELLIGACLVLRSDQLELLKNKVKSDQNNMLFCSFMEVIGLALICASIVFLNERLPFPSWWAVFPTVGTLLLIAIEDTSWINTKILSSRLFVEIGRISYSLYLWHWPLIVFWRIYDGGEPSSFARFNIIGLGYFHQKTTTCTKIFSDFNETFIVDRGSNSECFHKKIFF